VLSNETQLSPVWHERSLHRRGSLSSSRPSSPAVSTQSRDGPGDLVYERERDRNSPHPTWPDYTSGHSPSHGHPHALVGSSPDPHVASPTVSQNLTETGYKPSIRSLSPFHFHDEQASPTPSRTSSLDVMHRHRDASPRHPSRSPSPFLSFSRKNLNSTDKSMTSMEVNNSPTTSSRPKLPPSPSFDQSSRAIISSIRRTSTQTQTHISHTKSIGSVEIEEGQNTSEKIIEEMDTDGTRDLPFNLMVMFDIEMFLDLRETDFSQSDVHDTEIDDAQSHSAQPTRGLTPFSIPPNIPQIMPEDRTALKDSFANASSPSTPSRRSTPKSSSKKFKTLSPPKSLPDLPTPSSSDESEPKPRKHARTPAGSKGYQDYANMATPKPPGGWLQTPGPSHVRQDTGGTSTTSSPQVVDECPSDPATPARAAGAVQQTKTPKPPGGWLSTPAPAYTSISPQPEKAQGLLTPLPSLSKGTSIDLKTPAVPGGWGITPAARKSILKVRFNPETPSNQNGSTWSEQTNEELPATATHSILRKSKVPHTPSIRVVDAFGREQESNMSTEADAHRTQQALCVVDAMGHEIQEIDDMLVQDEKNHIQLSSRTELLSRIRRGLDDLVVDLDDVNECVRTSLIFAQSLNFLCSDHDHGARAAEQERMAELNAISMQARRNRERLHIKNLPVDLDLKHRNSVVSYLRQFSKYSDWYLRSLIPSLLSESIAAFILLFYSCNYYFFCCCIGTIFLSVV
jgi:hypothetical protein